MSDTAKKLIGETNFTNDRVLNQILQQSSRIIHKRDGEPLDKIETLHAYLSKMRREVLGKED